MQKKTLAIMAAGFGSRFGGLKQLYSFTENKYSILDFSIYDAIDAGFNNIVFIVRDDILNVFKQKYTSTLPSSISVTYVIQGVDKVPKAYKLINREKPWGTGHALLMLKDIVCNKFALINADDFYGKEAFKQMHDNLFNSDSNYLIGYQLDKTLSDNGTVSRGECYFSSDRSLKHIIERKQITKRENKTSYIEKDFVKPIEADTIVSMNFWGFSPEILNIAEKEFVQFLDTYNDDDSEFYITKVVESAINTNQIFTVLKTNSNWFGVTYKEDVISVSNQIDNLIDKGVYPKVLW